MPPDLTSPRPRQGSVSADTASVLVEWLLGWFDGQAKPFVTGGPSRDWPALTAERIGFGTSPLPSPLAGVFVTVLLLDRGKPEVFPVAPPSGVDPDARAALHESRYALQFIVRVSIGPAHPTWDTDDEALADVAGLLHGLLASDAARDQLEGVGILIEDEQHLPVPREGNVALALVTCVMRVRWMAL